MSASKLDAVYRSILLTKFFTKGWGKPENLRRLFEFRKVVSNRDECFKLIERDYPVTITKEENHSDCRLIEGYFTTPLEKFLPGIVPQIAQKAHFQALLPVHWPEIGCKPVCLHLAGTGDHFFWRRRNLMVKPLLKEAGIGGIILENPFYGLRKPTDQVRSSLHNVSDIFVMGGCLILESLVLFHWCERNGLGPLGVTGLSMGGHMASLAATNWPKPLVLVPCLSWSTASAVFLQKRTKLLCGTAIGLALAHLFLSGVMSQSINWDLLEDQYLSDGVYREKLSKMVTIVDEAFLAGKKFAQTYSQKVAKDEPMHAQKPVANKDNLDITYKESNGANSEGNGIIDLTKKVQELNEKVPKNIIRNETFSQMERLNEELRKLLEEGKISQTLYDKLVSNEKFQLEPDDINNINKLNQEDIRELIMRYKIESLKSETAAATEAQAHITKTESQTEIETPIQTKTVEVKPQLSKIHQDGTIVVKKPEKKSWNVSDLTSDIWVNLPFVRSSGRKIDINKIHWRDREALQFMRGIMDECTHLSNFSVPYDTSLIIAVCAKHDAYVPREDVGTLEEIWPGAEVRYVDAGHVSAYILHQSLFRACIREAFERSKKKWKDGKHIN